MKRAKTKKILALFLCFVMCFSLLPTWAVAEGEETGEEVIIEEEISAEEAEGVEPDADADAPEEEVVEDYAIAEPDADADAPEEEVVEEEVVEEAETVSSPAMNGAEEDAELFRQLKEAAENEDVHGFTLTGEGDFMLLEDVSVRGGFYLDGGGRTVVVPSGITLDTNQFFGTDSLRIEGSMVANDSHVEVYNSFAFGGDDALLKLEEADANLPSACFEGADEAFYSKFDVEQGHVSVQYHTGYQDQVFEAMNKAQNLPDRFDGNVIVHFEWEPDRDVTVGGKAGLIIEGAHSPGLLTIPSGRKFTVDSWMNVTGSTLTVEGELENNQELGLNAAQDAENTAIGSLVVADGGRYTGMGSIYVATTVNPDTYLKGLDLDQFVSPRPVAQRFGADCTVYSVKDDAIVDDFRAACARAAEDSGNFYSYDRLRNRGAFTLTGEITVPGNMQVDSWGTVITVSSGAVLTVQGNINADEVIVEDGGQIVVMPNSNLWIDNGLELRGENTVFVKNNGWFGMPVESWEGLTGNEIAFEGLYGGVKLAMSAGNEDDVRSMMRTWRGIDHVVPEINANFNWSLTGYFSLPGDVNLHIQKTLTIQDGATFENEGTYLGLHRATVTVQGTLKNNGFIDVRRENDVPSFIKVEGGAYEGGGEVCVCNVYDATEAEAYLGGLTELGTFHNRVEGDGVHFRMTEPDWTFARLQEVCSGTYEKEKQFDIPNEGELVITGDLTVPQNLKLRMENGTIIVQEGQTLTVEGALECCNMKVNGTLITRGGYVNVWGDTFEAAGSLQIQANSHLDATGWTWENEWDAHVSVAGENSWMNLHYDVTSVEQIQTVLGISFGNNRINKCLCVLFDWPLEENENLVLPDDMWVEIRNDGNPDGNQKGSLTIPATATLTVTGGLNLDGAVVTVNGALVNKNRIEIYRHGGSGELGKIRFADGGVYSGEGTIWVETKDEDEIRDCLEGLDLRDFEATTDDRGTLFTNNRALYESVKEAMDAKQNKDLPGGVTLVIPSGETLVIYENASLNFWGSRLEVSEGATVTVKGNLGGEELAIAGTVNVDGGYLNVNKIEFVDNNVDDNVRPLLSLKDGGAFIPAWDWKDAEPYVDFGKNCWLNLVMEARDLNELIEKCTPMTLNEIPEQATYWIRIFFHYDFQATRSAESNTLGVEPDVLLEFIHDPANGQFGRMTVGDGCTYKVDGSLLFQGEGATLTVQGGGTLINNNWIELNGDEESGYGRILFEKGAAYDGEGLICVRRMENPAELLGGLTEKYTFEAIPDQYGTLYRKTGDRFVFKAGLVNNDYTGVHLIVYLPEDADPADYVVETNPLKTVYPQDGQRVNLANVDKYGDGYMVQNIIKAASTEMTDVVQVKLLDKDGNILKEAEYSVNGIVQDSLAAGTLTPTQEKMRRALVQYGRWAQIRFGHKDTEDQMPPEDPSVKLEEIPKEYAHGADVAYAPISSFRVGINLASSVQIWALLTPASGYSLKDFDISISSEVGNPTAEIEEDGGTIYVKISGFYSYDMDKDVRIHVKLKGSNTGVTWTRSVISCAYDNYKGAAGNEARQNLMKALYTYFVATKAFFLKA